MLESMNFGALAESNVRMTLDISMISVMRNNMDYANPYYSSI